MNPSPCRPQAECGLVGDTAEGSQAAPRWASSLIPGVPCILGKGLFGYSEVQLVAWLVLLRTWLKDTRVLETNSL